jgi:TonB family protein
MKSLVIAAALTGVLFTHSASAYTPEELARRALVAASRPAPTVVQPIDLPVGYTGGTINVEFTLDPSGRPQDIRVPSVYDPLLKRQVVKAFGQWRFTPAANEPKHEVRRFVLPLQLKPAV